MVAEFKEVTFKDLAAVIRKRGLTPESLAQRFKGKIEQPAEFFHRVMDTKQADKVIPYRSVIEFFHTQSRCAGDVLEHRTCACGCGLAVFDRKKWASPGCRKRIARSKAKDQQNGVRQVPEFIDARV